MMILIQKYKNSDILSGGLLAKMLGLKIYSPKSAPRNKNQIMINWGLSSIPWLTNTNNVINKPESIRDSSNKLRSFNKFQEFYYTQDDIHDILLNFPEFTTDIQQASAWLTTDKAYRPTDKVVCRTLLSASSGRGIVIATNPEELVDAPLYTKYIKKKYELRVHIVQNRPIYVQQKKKLSTKQLETRGLVDRNKYIRNLENGYIFSSELSISKAAKDKAITQSNLAINALGLDFGAVDVIVTKDDEVFVLEVNTAPGLEGTTLTKYYEAFKEIYL